MKTDLKRLRVEAAEAQAKASYRKALSLYEEVCEGDPTDSLAHHRAGELHMRLGKPDQAVRRLRQGADLYAEQGFLVKAIAVCKIILQVDATHAATLGALVDLYSRKSQAESKGPQQIAPLAASAPTPALGTPQAGSSDSHGAKAVDAIALSTDSGYNAGGSLPAHMMGNVIGGDDDAPEVELATRNVAPTGVNATLRGAGARPAQKDEDFGVDLPDPNELIDLGVSMSTSSAGPAVPPRPAPTAPAPPPVPAGQRRRANEIRGGTPRALPPTHYGSAQPPRVDTGDVSKAAAAATAARTASPPPAAPVLLTPMQPPRPVATTVPPPPRPELLTPPSPPVRPALTAAHFAEGGIRTQKIGVGAGLPPELHDAIEINIDDDEVAIVSERPKALPETTLFAGLGTTILTELATRLEFVRVQEGEVIAREGEVGDALYVIADGEVVISVQGPPEREVGRLKDGEFFGEISVISDFPRTATVRAARETELLRLSRTVIWQLVEEHPEFLATLIRFVKMRLMETLQKTSPLFLALPAPERAVFGARFKLLEVENDHMVVEQGKRSEGLFVLLGGRFDVFTSANGDERRVAELGPGAIVGEVSLLTRQPAVSTVKTTRRSWVLWMSPSTFSEMLMTYPTVLEYVHELAEERRQAVARLQMA